MTVLLNPKLSKSGSLNFFPFCSLNTWAMRLFGGIKVLYSLLEVYLFWVGNRPRECESPTKKNKSTSHRLFYFTCTGGEYHDTVDFLSLLLAVLNVKKEGFAQSVSLLTEPTLLTKRACNDTRSERFQSL